MPIPIHTRLPSDEQFHNVYGPLYYGSVALYAGVGGHRFMANREIVPPTCLIESMRLKPGTERV